MSKSTTLPTGELRFVNQASIEALNEWLYDSSPSTALESFKTLMRGWIASDIADNSDARQRSEVYYDFERLCEFLQRLSEVAVTD